MSTASSPSPFERAAQRYLDHKRALGYRYRQEAWLLHSIHRHIEQRGSHDLTALEYESWLRSVSDSHANSRHKWQQILRNFCLYRDRREPGCFVPSADGFAKKQPHLTPLIVEPEQIARMLAITSKVQPTHASPLRAAGLRLAVVLLYTCGLRLGELLRLTVADLEDNGTVLRIRESKFHKSRLVPLSPSTAQELQTYLKTRHAAFGACQRAPLLCNRHGRPVHGYSFPGIQGAIRRLYVAAGIADSHGRRPRVHDLRHSFAVQALIRWYRNGSDVQTALPKLALYMGHVSIESSAYYLHWVPTLRRLASQRFEERFAALVTGGDV